MNAPLRYTMFFACSLAAIVPAVATATNDPVNGLALYTANCQTCHGTPPDKFARRAAFDINLLKFAIGNAAPMKVLANLQALTDDQLTDIVAYLASGGNTAPVNYQGLWWYSPGGAEDGWGINFAHQGDTIFGTWFTYDTTGKGWWLTLTANKSATGVYTGNLYATTGPPFNTVPFVQPAGSAHSIGMGTLTFTDGSNGSFNYSVNLPNGPVVTQTKPITRQPLGSAPLATCSYGTQPNLAAATNYQDIWWAGTSANAGTEQGWGINFAHQGDIVFASWFTYDLNGTPLWLVATLQKTAPGVYTGSLYRPSGPRFDAYDKTKFSPNAAVGTMTLTFADGNNATFNYTVQVAGMANPVTQSKSITRQLFSASGTTCQ